MKVLKMQNGAEWIITVNVATAMLVRARVRRRNGEFLDLLNIINVDTSDRKNPRMDLLEELTGDPLMLAEVIYTLLKEQLDKQNISEESFYQSLTGTDIENAVDLLMEELIDFFPEAKRRFLRVIWDSLAKIQQSAHRGLEQMISDPAWDERIEKLTAGVLSGNMPELSASTPEN